MSSVLCHLIPAICVEKADSSLQFMFTSSFTFPSLNFEYFKLSQQFLQLFISEKHLSFSTSVVPLKPCFHLFYEQIWQASPRPAQHGSGCAVLLWPVPAQINPGASQTINLCSQSLLSLGAPLQTWQRTWCMNIHLTLHWSLWKKESVLEF